MHDLHRRLLRGQAAARMGVLTLALAAAISSLAAADGLEGPPGTSADIGGWSYGEDDGPGDDFSGGPASGMGGPPIASCRATPLPSTSPPTPWDA